MRFLSILILAAFVTGCATTQSSTVRKTAQETPAHYSIDGLRLIDLTGIVIMNNNTQKNDLPVQVGVVKEVDEWLYKMLTQETAADELISRIYYAPAKADGTETYVVISKVMTNFNLNVVQTKKQGKKTVTTTAIYEIVAANQQTLELVKSPQEKPEGFTVISASRKLFSF
jgi:hypothetical protein